MDAKQDIEDLSIPKDVAIKLFDKTIVLRTLFVTSWGVACLGLTFGAILFWVGSGSDINFVFTLLFLSFCILFLTVLFRNKLRAARNEQHSMGLDAEFARYDKTWPAKRLTLGIYIPVIVTYGIVLALILANV